MRRPTGPLVVAGYLLAVVALGLLAGLSATDRDLSAGRTFTLSSETREFLAGVDEPVLVEIFFAEGQPGYGRVADLIDRARSDNGRIEVAYRDPDGERALDLGVVSGAVAVSSGGGDPVIVRTPDEADLVAMVGEATGRAAPEVAANRAPSQPLLPTPLGRRLLWLLPSVLAPLLAAGVGLTVTDRRRS